MSVPGKALKWFGIGLGSIVGILAVIFLALYVAFPEEWLARKAEAAARQSLPGWRLSIGRIAPIPLGRLSIGPIHLESPKKEIVFDLTAFEAAFKIPTSSQGPFVVSSVLLDRPILRIGRGIDKLFPAQEKTPGPFAKIDVAHTPLDKIWPEVERVLAEQTKTLPALNLERLEIRGFAASIDDGKTRATLPPLNLFGSLALTPTKRGAVFHLKSASNAELSARALNARGEEIRLQAIPTILLDLDWSGERVAKIQASALFNNIRASVAGNEGTYESFRSELGANVDLGKGVVEIQGPNIVFPQWVSSSVDFKVRNFGLDGISLQADLNLSGRKSFDPLVQFYLAALPGTKGFPEAKLHALLQGRLTRTTVAEMKKAAAALSSPCDFEFSSTATLKNFPPALLPTGITLASADLSLQIKANTSSIDWKSAAELNGLRVAKDQTGGIDLGPHSIRHEGVFSVENLRNIRVRTFTFSIPSLGAGASLAGTLASDIPFPELFDLLKTAKQPLRLVRQNITTDFNAVLQLDPPQRKWSPDVDFQGLFRLAFGAKISTTDNVMVHLKAEAEDFSAAVKNGVEMRHLSFRLPISKTLSLGLPSQKGEIQSAVWKKGLIDELKPISPYTNTLTLKSARKDLLAVENLSADVGFDGTNVLLQRLNADLLGGTLWAKLSFLPQNDKLDMTAALEVAQLDISKLSKERVTGDSKISADARAEIALHAGATITTEELLDDLEAKFHLTHIGDQTLDRTIAYLDPKGENPSFVQARGLLKKSIVESALKNPEVSFQITHGILDADIRLPGVKFVDVTIPIRGISVKDLLRLSGIRKSVNGLLPLLAAARYLQATGIDDDGKLVFRSAP